MVREGGLEPPCPHGHTDLNRARLPISPLALTMAYETPTKDITTSSPGRICWGRQTGLKVQQLTSSQYRRPRTGSTLGLLDNFEKGLERAVNGAFAKTFKSGLQPIEITSALRR